MHNTSENIVYNHHEAINSQDETGYLDTVKFPLHIRIIMVFR